MNYPSAEMTLGSITCKNLQAANLNFESTEISTLTVLDSTSLLTSVNIQANTFSTNEPLAVFDKEGNELYTLPTTEPSPNQVLTCPPSGTNLIWTNGGGGGGGQVNTITNTDDNLEITGTSDITINLASDIIVSNTVSALVLSSQVVVAPTVTLSGDISGEATAINLPTGWTGSIDINKAIISNGDNTSSWLDVVLGITNTDNNISITGTTANPIINLSNTILGATSIGAPIISSTQLLDVKGQLEDINNSVGQTGYLLSSTGNGVAWIENPTGSVATWAQNPADTDINTNGFQIQGSTGNVIDLNTDGNVQIASTGSVSITSTTDRIDLYPDTYVYIDKGLQSSQITCSSNLGLLGTITDGNDTIGNNGQALLSNGSSKVEWADIPITTISNTDNNLVITPDGNNYNINLANTITNYNVTSNVLQSYNTFYLTGELVDNNYQQGSTGYVLTSTVSAGGTYGALWMPQESASSWSTHPAVADVNVDNYNINNVAGMTANNVTVNTSLGVLGSLLDGNNTVGNDGMFLSTNGIGNVYWNTIPSVNDWSTFPASSNVTIGENSIIGATGNAAIHLGADNNLISGNETFINDGQSNSTGLLSVPNITINGSLSDTVSTGNTGYILTSTNVGVSWQPPSASMGIIGGTCINVDQSGDNNVINLDINADINMNGYNIGYTGSTRLYNNDPNLNSNYLELDQFGNLVLNNTANNVFISNPPNSVGGAIDMFVNWDGNNWGAELWLNNTVAQITTNSGANVWTFDELGSLRLPVADIVANISTPIGATGNINIFNYKGDGTNDISNNILLDSTSITLSTNNGSNNMTLDENGNVILSNTTNTMNIQTPYGVTGTIDIIAYNNDVPGTEIILGNDTLSLTSSNRANLITFDSNGVLNFDNTTTINMNNNEIVNANTISNPSETIDIYNGTSVAKNGEIRLESTQVVITAGSSSGSLYFDQTGTLLLSNVGSGINCNGTNVYNTKNIINNDTRSGYGYLNLIAGLNTLDNPNTELCSINITETDIELNVNNKAITTTLDADGVLTLPTTTMNANAGLVFPDATKQITAYNPDPLNFWTINGFATNQVGYGFTNINFSTYTATFGNAILNNGTLLSFNNPNQYYLVNFNYGGIPTTSAVPPTSYSTTRFIVSSEGGACVVGYPSGENVDFAAVIHLLEQFTFPISFVIYTGTTSNATLEILQAGDVLVSELQTTMTITPLPYNQNSFYN